MTESALCGSAEGADGRMEATRQSERLPRYGNGMPGVDGQRRQHGQERAAEVLLEEALLLLAGLLGAEQEDALGGEQRLDLLEEAAVLLVDQLVDARGHGGHASPRA